MYGGGNTASVPPELTERRRGMGEARMELGDRELKKIGEYVKSHLPQWISETKEVLHASLHQRELDILERVVRVEDELKNLREVMEERFGKMDERFEAQQRQMDERFEAQRVLTNERFDHLEKRTSFIQWGIGIGFTAILVLMGVLNYLG